MKIIIIGLGGLGYPISYYAPLWFPNCESFICIDKLMPMVQRAKKLCRDKQHSFIHKEIHNEDIEHICNSLSEGDFIFDCTVRTPCLEWIAIIKGHSINYINTSIEEAHEEGMLIADQQKIAKNMKNVKAKMLLEYGANPGIVSSFCYSALDLLSGELVDDYAKLCEKLRVRKIVISEIDTQRAKKINKKAFNNSWSAPALLDELNEGIELAGNWNNEPEMKGIKLQHKKIDGVEISYSHKVKANDVNINTICYTDNVAGKPKFSKSEAKSRAIHHGEISNIAEHLSTKDNPIKVGYSYSICPIADAKIKEVGLENAKKLKNITMSGDNALIGADNLGVVIDYGDHAKFWFGSCMNEKEVSRIFGNSYFGCTMLQVCVAMLSGASWLSMQDSGIFFGGDVDHKYISDCCYDLLNIKYGIIPKKYY